jgi:hypothetical protein
VGRVEGAGTTSEAQSYRFADADFPSAADTLLYRLKQIDTDGSTYYSETITVARRRPARLHLLGTAPNPARRRTTVRYAVPESASGVYVLRLQVSGDAQTHTLTVVQ